MQTSPQLPAGIVPMQYAFFRADGTLDLPAFRAQVKACVRTGVHGIAILGLATEVSKLMRDERSAILDAAAREIDGRLPLSVTVFGATPEEQIDFVREAERAGVHGIAILGLATEVSKLTRDERSALLEAAALEIGGRLPLSVTVFGTTPEEQIDFVREAERAGAASVVLQPPRIPGMDEPALLRFFGRVIDAAGIPAGIQNAPEYIGIGLGVESIETLRRNHANFRVLKGEASALLIRRTIEQTQGRLAVLNGRAGLELPDNFRAGCHGLIPGAEACDVLARVWTGLQGDEKSAAQAEALYREVLPLLSFLMQSMDQILCYGKRLLARRLELGEVFDRAPAQAPTAFGLNCLERHAARLPAWP